MRTSAVSAAFAAALLLTIAPSLSAQGAAAAPDRRPTLFVVDFRVSALGRQDDYAPLSQGIADLLVSELSQNAAVRVVDRENLRRILDEQDLSSSNRIDDATAVRVGRILGAHHFIKGSVFIDPRGKLRLDAHTVSTETSAIEHVETVTGAGDDVMELIAQLSDKLNKGMNLPDLPPASARPGDGSDGEAGAAAEPAAPASAPAATPSPASNVASNDARPAPSGGGKASGRAAAPSSGGAKKANFQAVMLYSRALAEEDKGNRAAAVELYRKSLTVFPDYDNAKARLARLEKRGG
ncbi:MAG: CsgG/HfaB family protein [Gemmatimonadaceae bacterium]